MRLLVLSSFLVLAALALPPAAQADTEAWVNSEIRVPLMEGGAWPRSLRIFNDYRYGTRYGGIGQALLRAGPLWEAGPLSVATHLTSILEQTEPGRFRQELRGELEGSLRATYADLRFNDRVRLERRWFAAEARWRARNQIRVTYEPDGLDWVPFVSEEAFWETGSGFNQNRIVLGLSHLYGRSARSDAGYLLRTRQDAGVWDFDHILLLTIFYDPRTTPILSDPSGG